MLQFMVLLKASLGLAGLFIASSLQLLNCHQHHQDHRDGHHDQDKHHQHNQDYHDADHQDHL